MDWQTGEVNAKYWVTNLLATTVGTSQEKTVVNSTVTFAAAPRPKVGSTGTGTCADTSYGGTCADHALGSYNSTKEGITTLEQCVDKVKGCSNGNYVSFSLKNEDCSWYE